VLSVVLVWLALDEDGSGLLEVACGEDDVQ
jgi:hypothetical protein